MVFIRQGAWSPVGGRWLRTVVFRGFGWSVAGLFDGIVPRRISPKWIG